MNSQYFSISQGPLSRRLHYLEWGDRDRSEILVCVHGLTRNGRDFDNLASVLADQYRVICPDIAGRGKSDWLQDPNHYNYGLYVNDMAQLLRHITSSQAKITWLGTSMGGIIGMVLAANAATQTEPSLPISKLILNDVGIIIPKSALQRLAGYVGVTERFKNVEEWEIRLRKVAAPFGLSDAHWKLIAQHSCFKNSDGDIVPAYDPNIAIPFCQNLDTVDLTPLWDKIECPVLLIRGQNSDVLTSETAQQMQLRNNCKLIEIAGVGHAPMFMDDQQIEIVKSYLFNNRQV